MFQVLVASSSSAAVTRSPPANRLRCFLTSKRGSIILQKVICKPPERLSTTLWNYRRASSYSLSSLLSAENGGSLSSRRVPPTPYLAVHNVMTFSSLSPSDIQKRLDDFQELFVEARLCIEDVNDSAGTKYFEEDLEEATRAVEEAVKAFTDLVDSIDDVEEKNSLLRSNGLKVEQLKGELKMALDAGGDHH
jgi:hypothetical protein